MKNKSWSKTTWVQIVLFAAGITFIVVGSFLPAEGGLYNILKTICISVGCSMISSVIITGLRLKSEEVTIQDIEETVDSIKDMIGNIKNTVDTIKNVVTNTKDTVKQFSVKGRIVIGKHLKDQFRTMYEESYTADDSIVRIDVIGLELFNFWRDQKDFLLKLDKYKVRLIVQNPYSPYFEAMVNNETMSLSDVKKNIINLTKSIKKLNAEGNNNIEIRWISFPASITFTRVNNKMYVRTRLINAAHKDNLHFFEPYVESDSPFNTYIDYFESAWDKFDADYEMKEKFNGLDEQQ